MLNRLRSLIIFPAVLLPILMGSQPVQSQEHQGCYMINDLGAFIDLSEICPLPRPLTTSASANAGSQQLGTGDIQVTLRWATADDLDLGVTDPSNDTVTYFNTSVPSGGQLDVDANAGCSGTTQSPIENIFWPPSQAPQGNYSISVNLFSRCGTQGPVSFEITLLVQGQTQTLRGTVDEQNPTVTFPFSLPQQ